MLSWCRYCGKRIKKRENAILLWEWDIRGRASYGGYYSYIYHKWCSDIVRKDNKNKYYDYNPKERENENKRNEIKKAKNIYLKGVKNG